MPDAGPDADGLVHQYTSLSTLHALAKSEFKSMWASSALYMNDSKEFEVGRELFQNVLTLLKGTTKKRWIKAFADKSLDTLRIADGMQAYCACFSREGDHLGQWRGYGDQARGCCLSFDFKPLSDEVTGLGAWVVYEPAIQKAVAQQVVDGLLKTVELIGRGHKATDGELKEIAVAAFRDLAPALCLIFKDESFSEEREFRLIYTDSIAGGVTAVPDSYLRNHFFVPFVRLTMRGGDRLPVRLIKLGPGVKSDKHVASVVSMLENSRNTGINVRTSAIPFLPQ